MSKVFISYRQLDDTQRQRVRDFAVRVRDCGIDVVLDQFYKEDNPGASDDGWTIWSENQAEDTERILIIASPEWFECYTKKSPPGNGLGAAAEAHIIHRRITKAGTRASGIRVVALDEQAKKSIPLRLDDFPYFSVYESGVFEEMIAWLGGTVVTVATPTPIPTPLTWPPRCHTFTLDMANRLPEFEFFADTLCGNNPKRATLISAASGHGKTKLVTEFHRYGSEVIGHQRCSLIDFKSNATTDYLLDTLAIDLGGSFAQRSPTALRAALRGATEPLLLVIDTFERAPGDTKDFVEANILADLRSAPAVRVLLAGQPQNFPDPSVSAWGTQARRFDLGFIPDPEPWIEWAKGYKLVTEDMVRHVVAATRGAPAATADMIQSLGCYSKAQFTQMGIK